MASPQRIQPGQQLPGIRSADHNAFVETWEKVRQLVLAGAGTGASDGAQRVTCLIKNDSGALIDEPFPVLEITKPVFTVSDDPKVIRHGIVLEGTTPGVGVGINDVAIVQGAIPYTEFREAVVLGPTWCRIDVLDEAHTHAIPKDNDNTQLQSSDGSTGGVPIVWKEAGTGTKWAFVILGACCGGGGGGAGDCQVTVGCGLEVVGTTGNFTLQLKQSDLPGGGLVVGQDCSLDVDPGDGIELEPTSKKVQAKIARGLNFTVSTREIEFFPGQCLEFNPATGAVDVDLECEGLGGGGECNLSVGCGITMIGDELQAKLARGLVCTVNDEIEARLGECLQFDPSTGAIDVDLDCVGGGSCNLTIGNGMQLIGDELSVKLAAGGGLQFNASGELELAP